MLCLILGALTAFAGLAWASLVGNIMCDDVARPMQPRRFFIIVGDLVFFLMGILVFMVGFYLVAKGLGHGQP